MKKLFKKSTAMLLAVIMFVSCFACGSMVAFADDETIIYTLGEEYEGYTTYSGQKYFQITLKERSHLYVTFQSDYGNINCNVYNSSGNCVSTNTSTLISRNDSGNICYYSHSCNLNSGTYKIGLKAYHEYFSFVATAEPTVSLTTPAITAISSPEGGKFNVKYTGVDNALSYQVQFSKNTSFSGATVKENPSTNYTAGGIAKGVYYYVRVRAFTVYNDGLKVYSNWSRAQAVYVKKLNNAISILNDSESIKYKNLKKKAQSFLVVATDKANAKLTYSIDEVTPSKKKKAFKIDKTSGKLTVKKGLAKGTYTVKVKVTSEETNSYKKASATKTIKIKVK